ncbi:MAG TPA: hypothetical protein VNT30_26115 [Stellaceae bacterium]|nr:hypothetical protein [Stellaceae bacterium]
MDLRKTSIEAQAAILAERRALLGWSTEVPVLPNSGSRRTQEKRDLLKAIETSARSQGRKPKFTAAY